MGNYRLGLSAALRVYKQSGSQIQYAHSAGEKGVYHLSGLGSHYAGFEGNANSQTRYRGSGYGLTLALVPDAGRGGLHLAAGYEYLHIEKELPGSADLVLQKVVPRSFHAEAAWLRGSGNGLRWGVALKARYDYRRGDEGIVDDNNSSQGSGTLGFLTLFEYSALQGRAEAVFGVEAAGHAWYVCPWGEYRRRTSDYLYPAQNMEFTRAGGGVDFRCVLQRRSLLLRLEAGGGYTAGLDSGLTLPVADSPRRSSAWCSTTTAACGRMPLHSGWDCVPITRCAAGCRSSLRRITGAGFTATTRRRTMRGLPAALRSETDNIHLNNFLNL